MAKQTTIYLDETLKKEIKKYLIDIDMNLSFWVVDRLKKEIEQHQNKEE